MPLENFTPVQEQLAEIFDSDPKVKALAGVMRLPGFFHRKGEPFLIRMKALYMPTYPAAFFQVTKRSKHKRDDDIEINVEKVIAALDAMPNPDVDEDVWFKLMAATWRGSDGHNDAYDAFVRWSRRSYKHDDKRTRQRWRGFDRNPPRDIGPGTLYNFADKTAPGWREAMLARAIATLTEQYAAEIAAKAKGAGHAS
jgi:primase-like protein